MEILHLLFPALGLELPLLLFRLPLLLLLAIPTLRAEILSLSPVLASPEIPSRSVGHTRLVLCVLLGLILSRRLSLQMALIVILLFKLTWLETRLLQPLLLGLEIPPHLAPQLFLAQAHLLTILTEVL